MSRFQQQLPRVLSAMQHEPSLSLAELAAIACCAPSHFQRLFGMHVGLSVKRYQRLLALDRAAMQLAFRAHRITDIAYAAGFASPEAFSRAFTDFTSQSPRAFRQQPDWLAWQQAMAAIQPLAGALMFNANQISLVQRPPIPIALLEHHGAPALLGQSIRQFIAFRKDHGLPPSKASTYNLMYQDPRFCEPSDFRFGLACHCEQVPTNAYAVVPSTIASGLYARLEITGNDEQMSRAMAWLCYDWLAQSPYSLADAAIVLERVRFYPDVAADDAVSVIYLPLQPSLDAGSDTSS